jgi:hypothetical protein
MPIRDDFEKARNQIGQILFIANQALETTGSPATAVSLLLMAASTLSRPMDFSSAEWITLCKKSFEAGQLISAEVEEIAGEVKKIVKSEQDDDN